MTWLFLLFLGFPGSIDPGTPIVVPVDTGEHCMQEVPRKRGYKSDFTHAAHPKPGDHPPSRSACIQGWDGPVNKYGEVAIPDGARAGFFALFDTEDPTRRAASQFVFYPSMKDCEDWAAAYREWIGNFFDLPEDKVKSYPRTACFPLYETPDDGETPFKPGISTSYLVVVVNPADPKTIQAWSLPMENHEACKKARAAFGKAFDINTTSTPVIPTAHRAKMALNCEFHTIPSKAQNGSYDDDPAMRSSFIAVLGDPVDPASRTLLRIPMRDASICQIAFARLFNSFEMAVSDIDTRPFDRGNLIRLAMASRCKITQSQKSSD